MEDWVTWSASRPRRPRPTWALVAGLSICICGQLLQLLPEAAAAAEVAEGRGRDDVTTSLTLVAPPPALALARGKGDYDDYDYGEDDDDDADYDYYGTKQKKKKKKKKPAAGAQAAAVAPSETNVFNFVRIMVLRIVWGFASLFGFEEPLAEAFNGAFVPPGVDYDGDDGLGFDY